MQMTDPLLAPTKLLDFDAAPLAHLIETRGWRGLSEYDRIGAAYDFVRNEIAFGYNRADDIPASEVLSDGYGQCNTKGTLLMALLRGVGIRCRLHGFTIHKGLQRGVVPELVYPLAPQEILHSWVEIEFQDSWINLEGFILDDAFLKSQTSFSNTDSLRLGARDCLGAPPVAWKEKIPTFRKPVLCKILRTIRWTPLFPMSNLMAAWCPLPSYHTPLDECARSWFPQRPPQD